MTDSNLPPSSSSQVSNAQPKPSWARWWRQVAFVPMRHSHWLPKSAQDTLTQAVAQAEAGHRGEIVLVVENTLPLKMAHRYDCWDRALELFGRYRVWDTADNTGVLVYLNVCERRLEIVADRGISRHVADSTWQAMCDRAISGIRAKHQVTALTELLHRIGEVLRQHYRLADDPQGNELPDTVVFIR